MIKKKMIISTMLGLSALSLAFGFVGLNQPIQAQADSQFVMISGASVRMKSDDTGIRFMANVPEGSTAEYKMLILPEGVLTQNSIEDNFVTELSTIYATQIESAGGFDNLFWNKSCTPFESADYGYIISGAMTGLPETTYAQSFVGIAYTMENGEYIYADYPLKKGSETEKQTIFDNARTISYVASAALCDEDPLVELTTDDKTTLKGFIAPVLNGDFSLTETALDLKVQRSASLSIDADCNLKAVWTSENKDVATVDENGVVTGVSVGHTTITAKIGDDYSVSCTVTVTNDKNNAIVNSAVTSYTEKSYQYFYSSVNASEDSAEKYADENTVKYVISDDGRSPSAGRRWFAPMEFDADNTFADFLATLGVNVNTINKNSKISFYVKNASTNYNLAFVFMNSYKEGGYWGLKQIAPDGNGSYASDVTHIDVSKNSDWTKVEFSLGDLYDDLMAGTGRVSLCAGYLSTPTGFTPQTFYIGGFEVYTPTAEDIIPAYATSMGNTPDWYKAGEANATTGTFQGEKVVKYDVTVNSNVTNISAVNKGKNVMANMFVAKSNMPSELLSVCDVTESSWNKMTISFKVYSDVDVGFSAFYTDKTGSSSSTIISSSGNAQVECKAGEWTTVTFELDITSATFTTGYNLVIVGRSFCDGSIAKGEHAYTYYVKDFAISVA